MSWTLTRSRLERVHAPPDDEQASPSIPQTCFRLRRRKWHEVLGNCRAVCRRRTGNSGRAVTRMGTALLGGRREASISQHSLPSWPRSCPWSAGLGRALLSSLACSASRGPTLLGVIKQLEVCCLHLSLDSCRRTCVGQGSSETTGCVYRERGITRIGPRERGDRQVPRPVGWVGGLGLTRVGALVHAKGGEGSISCFRGRPAGEFFLTRGRSVWWDEEDSLSSQI